MQREERITFFETPGPACTGAALDLAREVWEREDLARVVVASTSGETGIRAMDVLGSQGLVVVGHHYGFKEAGASEMDPEKKEALEKGGARVLFASHIFSGIGRSVTGRFNGITPTELMSQTLKILGEGFKVCLEMAVMTADAGLVPVDRESLFIGGSGRGADTVVILRPTHANRWFDLGVPRIVCMPEDRRR